MIGVCDFNPSFFSHFCILYRVLVGRESTPADMDGSSGQKTVEKTNSFDVPKLSCFMDLFCVP
jgi:hypothetical protein